MKKLYPSRSRHRSSPEFRWRSSRQPAARATSSALSSIVHGGAFLWGAAAADWWNPFRWPACQDQGDLGRLSEGPEETYPRQARMWRSLSRTIAASQAGEHRYLRLFRGRGADRAIDCMVPGQGSAAAGCDRHFFAPAWSTWAEIRLSSGRCSWARTCPRRSRPDWDRFSYFKGADFKSALVLPAILPAVLAKFPPTLADIRHARYALSAALRSNELLTQAGATTELHVWEGMCDRFFPIPNCLNRSCLRRDGQILRSPPRKILPPMER